MYCSIWRHLAVLLTLCLLARCLPTSGPLARAAEDPTAEARQAISPQVIGWLRGALANPADTLAELEIALASSPLSGEAIDNLVRLYSRAESRIGELIAADTPSPASEPPDWLLESGFPREVRTHVALAVAGRLHALGHYEESLGWLAGVEPDEVVAPHLLLYYRAVAQHQLVRLAEAQESAERLVALVEDGAPAARRHVELARLIIRDAEGAKPDSLDHLARTMNDIRRRLSLGRSADPERGLQQDVLKGLDKLIEQAEQQQQQQAGLGGPSAPIEPMQDSRPGELKAPGEVDPRDVAEGGDWGSLPPGERERVTQQIGRDFPGYYRDLIEAYFQSLATPAPTGDESPAVPSQP